jgi:hypothetical protein
MKENAGDKLVEAYSSLRLQLDDGGYVDEVLPLEAMSLASRLLQDVQTTKGRLDKVQRRYEHVKQVRKVYLVLFD